MPSRRAHPARFHALQERLGEHRRGREMKNGRELLHVHERKFLLERRSEDMKLKKFSEKSFLRHGPLAIIQEHALFASFQNVFRENMRPVPKPGLRPGSRIGQKKVKIRSGELHKSRPYPSFREVDIVNFLGRQINIAD